MNKVGLKEKSIIFSIFLFVIYLSYTQINKQKPKIEIKKEEPKKIVVKSSDKKEKFKKIFVPVITKVYNQRYEEYLKIKNLIEINSEDEKLIELKNKYNLDSNEELLIVLKPHPISIALAQAAIESAWGTSRFFKEANNIFGVWSFNKNEPRIAANVKREEETIYLKKFDSIEAAVSQYFNMLSTKKIYFEFKKENYFNTDIFQIVKKLDRYSEEGEEYIEKIISVIKYNNFHKYDKILG
ncbi:glucosaminidase domain-containing protein [Arcobacter arenosus]|jgi:Bax protein|uniref:Mannosyl-glycoprotein endo-beta-N-acetylglucosamidase-like domain-containing protein n=1 Tax=Arcobacter arenosus TaxID=2576037 RepID=A0A5R8XZQ2_9BACT|nr:glucosaminidase domain-containing protein [Arcobacter arenosus]TLP37709.1 hypothetical protein FDK22_10350 [Arcobacter arenosus]